MTESAPGRPTLSVNWVVFAGDCSVAKCVECGKSTGFLNSIGGYCPDCHFARQRLLNGESNVTVEPKAPERLFTPEEVSAVILSTEGTTDLVVEQRIDIITAEFAVGMNLLTDVFNAFRDVFGGRSSSYQNVLKDARKHALRELRREALQVGANAVLGVRLDYNEISGGGKSMLFLVASGTAVRVKMSV